MTGKEFKESLLLIKKTSGLTLDKIAKVSGIPERSLYFIFKQPEVLQDNIDKVIKAGFTLQNPATLMHNPANGPDATLMNEMMQTLKTSYDDLKKAKEQVEKEKAVLIKNNSALLASNTALIKSIEEHFKVIEQLNPSAAKKLNRDHRTPAGK